MNIDKYKDIALRNPIGCAWYEYLDARWSQVAQRLSASQIFSKYQLPNYVGPQQVQLTQQIVGLMVWTFGFSDSYVAHGVSHLPLCKEHIQMLRTDLAQLGRKFTQAELNSNRIPLEVIIIDRLLEKWRSKIF